jgi:hypothetical protein
MIWTDLIRTTAPYRALASIAGRLEKLSTVTLKKNDPPPDPGGMRDEMEREFLARERRSTR